MKEILEIQCVVDFAIRNGFRAKTMLDLKKSGAFSRWQKSVVRVMGPQLIRE